MDIDLINIFMIAGAFLFFLLLIGIILYVLLSIGLYKMALNRKIENPWLAWIPVGNMYIIGKLIGSLKIGGYDVPSIELVLTIGSASVIVLGSVPFIGQIISIAYLILLLFALHRLFSIYRSQNATLWLILSIVFPFMGPIFT